MSNAEFPAKPNLILIVTDQDRGLMHFPPGWELQNLRAMPQLRNNGLSFTNAFCSACMCSPSRASLFTGVYPPEHGVISTLTQGMQYSGEEPVLNPDYQNMARMLKAGGYSVTYIGKWHLSKAADGSYDDLTTEDLERYGFDGWGPPDAGEDTAPEHFGAGQARNDIRYIQQAVNFLVDKQKNPADKPFALIVSLVNPHDVLAYPSGWKDDFAPSLLEGDIQLPSTVDEDLSSNYKPSVQQQFLEYSTLGLWPLPTDDIKRNYLNFYGNLIKWSDSLVKLLLDVLYLEYDTVSGRTLADDTLVIRTADHGEMGLTHGGMRQKAYNAYDETISVPMVFSNPKLFSKPAKTNQLITLVDIMPTLNGLLNLGNPLGYTFRGEDLSSVILNPKEAETVQDAILFTFDDFRAGSGGQCDPMKAANRLRTIREADWKYSRYFYVAPECNPDASYPDEFEMYNLKHDPTELQNLANPDHPFYNLPEVVQQRERLAARLAELEAEKLPHS